MDRKVSQTSTNLTQPKPRALRSAGPLTATEIAAYRAQGTPLAYDPVQIGWVPADSVDDIDMVFKPARGPRYPKLRANSVQSYALRSWRPSDIEEYHQMLDDPQVWRYMPEPYPDPLRLADAAMLIDLSNTSNHHEVRAVVHQGRPIGQVRLQFDTQDTGTAELSYWLGRAHWGQGHGAHMVELYVKRSFTDHPSLTRLTARIRPANTLSSRILKRAGFSLLDRPLDGNWQWLVANRPIGT
jgi:RimJ/RimL family protein N-acetyltransferase